MIKYLWQPYKVVNILLREGGRKREKRGREREREREGGEGKERERERESSPLMTC